MSRGNPKKAMAAALPLDLEAPGGVTVRPMTLAMYAALERIDSPLVTGVDAKDTLELLPSVYLLVHGPAELFRGNLLERALAWADTVPRSTLDGVYAACVRQLAAATDVIPESGKKKAPRAMTAGSPRSPITSPAPTTGRGARSSGKRPSPSSRCYAARTACAPDPSSRSR